MSKFLHFAFYILHSRKGQSLVEILVAVGVGAILVTAATTIIAPSLRINTQANRAQTGTGLAKELMENVRSWAEGDWHNISNLATSSANTYFLALGQSPFVAVRGVESVVIGATSTAGLVGYWKLDEAAGTVAYDFSGNALNAAYVSSPAPTSSCQIGWCLYTSAGYLNAGSGSSLNITGDTTITAWIRLTAATFPNRVTNWTIAANEVFQASGFIFRVDGAQTKLYMRTNQAGAYTDKYGTLALAKNVWYHVAITKSGTTGTFYVNGSNDGSGTFTLSNPVSATQPFSISNNGQGMDGVMDDVRVYNRALSAAEISQLYNGGVTYTRDFYVDDVYRDSGDLIASGGSSYDPSTKKLSVEYNWPTGTTSTIIEYITRNRDNIFWQTDWSGGCCSAGPATTTGNQFATSTSIDYSTTTGSIIIKLH